jgi:hypothetical protein
LHADHHTETALHPHRVDGDILEDLELAETPRRLLDSGRVIWLAGSERELSADDVLPGGKAESVHAPCEETRLRLLVGEHVVDDDDHRVDDWCELPGDYRLGQKTREQERSDPKRSLP